MKSPKVAILTPLSDFSPAYSLSTIILDHARMLKRGDVDYRLLCHQSFNEDDKRRAADLNVDYCLPSTKLHDYRIDEAPLANFERDVQIHERAYLEQLKDTDVVFTHDLMFLGWHLVQNEAIRNCAKKLPNVRWFHWCHSAPSGVPQGLTYPSTLRYEGAPNSKYVFLNNRARQDLANHLQIPLRDVFVVYNPKDPRDVYNFSEDTCRLVDEHKLLDHDVLMIYPFSTPRWKAKGVDKILAIAGHWSRMGAKVRLVLINSHCTQERDETKVRQIENIARKMKLSVGGEVIFTSRFAAKMEEENPQESDKWEKWRYTVPSRIVRDLGHITNLFIFPSVSECCSLIQAEAAIGGKFMVLNESFAPMMDFAASNVLAYKFNQNDPGSNPRYYEDLARELWAILEQDPNWKTHTLARTRWYNRDWVWERQMKPLLSVGALP